MGQNRTVINSFCDDNKNDETNQLSKGQIGAINAILNISRNLLHSDTSRSMAEQREILVPKLSKELENVRNQSTPTAIIQDLCSILELLLMRDSIRGIREVNETLQQMISDLSSGLEAEQITLRTIKSGFDYTAFRNLESDEQRLLNALMTNYEKSVRPVMKASQPVELKIGLTLNQIDVVCTP